MPPTLGSGRRRLLLRLVLIGFAQAAAAVTSAVLVQTAFDRLLALGVLHARFLGLLGLGLAGAGIAGAVFRVVERADSESMGQAYVHDVRLALTERLTALSPRALQGRSHGAVTLRFVGDLSALRQWVSLGLARLAVAATSTGAGLLALIFINAGMGLAVAGVVVLGGLVSVALGPRLRSATKEARRRRSSLAANVTEKVASLAVVQAFGQVDRERRRIERQSRALADAMVERADIAARLAAVTEGTATGATGAALFVGVMEVSSGRTTPGAVVAAMTIVGLLVSPLRDLGRVAEYRQNARVAMEKLREFLETPVLVADVPDAPALAAGPGRLEFRAARVEGAVEEVSVVAEPGQRVAIVGPNGAGKSTLLMLAARLIDPDGGQVLLDGQDLARHSLASVRRAVGIASAELPLLRGTIDRNLRYRWPDAPEEELQRVRDRLALDEMVAELPQGMETRVGEGGSGLSVGQRQRLILARALVGEPRLLLLDEPEAGLDADAEEMLWRVVTEQRGTVLFVTHRSAALAAADVVWRLEGGRLVAAGPPSILASQPEASSPLGPAPQGQPVG
ncbi:MAG: ABC transporter ATP-binding protein/permease [Chloroflexota bacterium]|nr:ABC transporter ATP-binding protein/permease [Chloroflexota bacterium]